MTIPMSHKNGPRYTTLGAFRFGKSASTTSANESNIAHYFCLNGRHFGTHLDKEADLKNMVPTRDEKHSNGTTARAATALVNALKEEMSLQLMSKQEHTNTWMDILEAKSGNI
ncbi:Hypothetical predicted protein [Podarcis lilfordi]|uniref:Uncharacterized protein n=1 Tax=Podarcis lilfordi TaxID=74358 RepID=A0AA35K9F0_9SAUR|nr:Hypothetical predicted protein [Podarcis lilfordi]